MRSLIGSIVNRSPVPLSPTRRAGDIFRSFSRGSKPLEIYGQVGTLFAVVNTLASDTAAVRWTCYKTAASGLEEDRVPAPEHPSVELWSKPNPHMPGRMFREIFQQHVELVGEADFVISTVKIAGANVPIEMWPVRPDRIKPVPDPYEFIKGYVYTSPDGEKVPLEPYEVQRIMMPNPADPYRGLGPVQAIMTDLDSAKYSAEWNRNFFENSAEPGGVIEVDHRMEDDEFDELRERWNAGHRGVNKAHRVAILESGAKYVARGFTQKDMQFAELRTLSRNVILEAFGFPKHMLGIAEDVNRANAEAAEYIYAKYRMVQRLDRIKGMLNHGVLPMYGKRGQGYEWDYENPVAENSEARNAAVAANSAALVAMVEKGFEVEDVLQYLGMPEIGYEKPAPPPAPVIPPPGKDVPEGEPADEE